MRNWLFVLAACALGSAAEARAPGSRPVVLVTLPTADVIETYYPPLGRRLEVQGEAVVACRMDAAGKAQACQALAESPPGLGFGKQAELLVRSLQFTPRSIAGVPAPGRWIGRIRFRLADDGAPEVNGPPALDQLSPGAVAAAGEFADLARVSARVAALTESYRELVARMCVSGQYPDCDDVDEALKSQTAPMMQEARELIVRELAGEFSEADIRSAIEFFKGHQADPDADTKFLASPLGQAFAGKSEAFRKGLHELDRLQWATLHRGFRKSYCNIVGCAPLPKIDPVAYQNGDPSTLTP